MLRADKCLENNETRDSPLDNEWPPSPDLSPRIVLYPGAVTPAGLDAAGYNTIRGERRRMGRNADPGRHEGLLPLALPWATL